MKNKAITIGLLVCSIALAITAGCVRQEESNSAPIAPVAEANHEPESETMLASKAPEWEAHAPFRHSMMRMWLDMGLIVSSSSDIELSDLDFLENSSNDLQTRAERFAEYWQNVQAHTGNAIRAANNDNWDDARTALNHTHNACAKCHYEFWPMSTRGFAQRTVDAWEKSQSPFGEEHWNEQSFSSPPSMAKMMDDLRLGMRGTFAAIDAQDADALKESAKPLYSQLRQQYKWWSSIAVSAGKIKNARFNNTLDDIPKHFNEIRNVCITCHAMYSDGQGKTPLPWPTKD